MSGYFYVLFTSGWQWGQHLGSNDPLYLQATTACLAAIIIAQMTNLFACRSDINSVLRISLKSNPFIIWGLVWEFGVLLLLVYTWPGRALFRTRPLSADVWLFLMIFPPVLILADEMSMV